MRNPWDGQRKCSSLWASLPWASWPRRRHWLLRMRLATKPARRKPSGRRHVRGLKRRRASGGRQAGGENQFWIATGAGLPFTLRLEAATTTLVRILVRTLPRRLATHERGSAAVSSGGDDLLAENHQLLPALVGWCTYRMRRARERCSGSRFFIMHDCSFRASCRKNRGARENVLPSTEREAARNFAGESLAP
jgi:hypothetical protein